MYFLNALLIKWMNMHKLGDFKWAFYFESKTVWINENFVEKLFYNEQKLRKPIKSASSQFWEWTSNQYINVHHVLVAVKV